MRVKPQKIVRSEEESMNNTCSQKWAEWCNFGMSTGYSFNFHWHEKTATNIVSSKNSYNQEKKIFMPKIQTLSHLITCTFFM